MANFTTPFALNEAVCKLLNLDPSQITAVELRTGGNGNRVEIWALDRAALDGLDYDGLLYGVEVVLHIGWSQRG